MSISRPWLDRRNGNLLCQSLAHTMLGFGELLLVADTHAVIEQVEAPKKAETGYVFLGGVRAEAQHEG